MQAVKHEQTPLYKFEYMLIYATNRKAIWSGGSRIQIGTTKSYEVSPVINNWNWKIVYCFSHRRVSSTQYNVKSRTKMKILKTIQEPLYL